MLNVQIEVVWGLGVTKVTTNITIWQSVQDFLFDLNRNYASIL